MKTKAVLLVLLGALACAGQDDPTRTIGLFNGRFWQSLGPAAKLSYVLGVNDGVAGALAVIASSNKKYTNEKYTEVESAYFSKTMNYGDIVKSLDRFYDAPENMPLPILDGLMIGVDRAKGLDPMLIEKLIAGFRRAAQPAAAPTAQP